MTRGTTVTFNFVDRSTSKWPCTTRSVKQAKQGGDIGHASVLKGVASCITICYMGLRTFRKWGLPFPPLHIETVLTPLFAFVSLEMRKRAGACQFSKWRRNAYTNIFELTKPPTESNIQRGTLKRGKEIYRIHPSKGNFLFRCGIYRIKCFRKKNSHSDNRKEEIFTLFLAPQFQCFLRYTRCINLYSLTPSKGDFPGNSGVTLNLSRIVFPFKKLIHRIYQEYNLVPLQLNFHKKKLCDFPILSVSIINCIKENPKYSR